MLINTSGYFIMKNFPMLLHKINTKKAIINNLKAINLKTFMVLCRKMNFMLKIVLQS